MGNRTKRENYCRRHYFYVGGVKRILICDSDCTIQGTQVSGITVLSPDRLQIELGNIDISEIAVLVTVASLDVQDEIIINISRAEDD